MPAENSRSVPKEVERYLEPEYQAWLIAKGFMEVSDRSIDGIDFHTPFMYSRVQAIIAETFANNLKRLVSTTRLSRALYEGQDDPLHISYTRGAMTRFRERMVNPELILVVNGIGYGLGVERFTLYPKDVALMDYFWQHEDQWSPISSIVTKTGMSEEAVICRIMTWRKREDYGRTFIVQSRHSSGNGYMFSTDIKGVKAT